METKKVLAELAKIGKDKKNKISEVELMHFNNRYSYL